MPKNKNRKSFIAVIQAKHQTARVYRIKQNKPVLLGFMRHINLSMGVNRRDEDIVSYLKYNGNVLAGHSVGNEFTLTVV
jgi:hypothetical protein